MKVIITGTTGYVGEVAEAMIAVTKGGYHKPALSAGIYQSLQNNKGHERYHKTGTQGGSIADC